MGEEDTRSLPGAAQAALRKRAVQAVLDGMTHAEVARVFGVSLLVRLSGEVDLRPQLA